VLGFLFVVCLLFTVHCHKRALANRNNGLEHWKSGRVQCGAWSSSRGHPGTRTARIDQSTLDMNTVSWNALDA